MSDLPARRSPVVVAILLLMAVLGMAHLILGVRQNLLPLNGPLTSLNDRIVGNDFLGFYSAAMVVWDGAAPQIFDRQVFASYQARIVGADVGLPWAYPPPFLLLLAPLGALPYLPALYVWAAGGAALFLTLLWRLNGRWLPAIAALPALSIAVITGQNGAYTASLVAMGLMFLPTRPILAGCVFGLLCYKPHLSMVIPFCLMGAGQWRTLAAQVIMAAVLCLVSVAVFDFDIWRGFFAHLPEHLSYVSAGMIPLGRLPTTFALVFS
ncbi:MAG TPA: glycosyltransferase family 87 protein, partial [Azospirillaceae bacterium]|nr:glycosyltransferase family 87 protein [Azospirillaceae bacterium]